MIRVVIADDHPVMRYGLAALLGSLEDMEVVAVVADGREAVKEVVLLKPDVALLDLQMPNLDGFAALREISRLVPATALCVLTMYDDDDSLFAAMKAGARGYLLKGAEQEDIARAVRAVCAGEAVFGPGVAARVLQHLTVPATPATRPFSSAHRAGVRGAGLPGFGSSDEDHRQPARRAAQDRQQPRLKHRWQAAPGRSRAGRHCRT